MSDPYETLELERSADARAIKAAYFRLMRLHPPEKDPEEFQRIRAAYDLLSDPERRAAFDAEQVREEELGEEVQAVLRASRECMSQDEPAKARDMLERLLAQSPSLAEARELLGFAFLRLEQAGPALQQFELLAQADPKSVNYRIHVAQTLRILERIPEATEAARSALALDPTNADAAILFGELLGAASSWDEAFAIWEKTIASATSVVDALRLRLCFVQAHLDRRDRKATEDVFGQLARELDRHNDNDLRRFVADGLSSLSARMFAEERALAGTLLLGAAGRFSPAPVFEASLPSRIRVLLEDLPQASRDWLAEQVQDAKRALFSWSNPWLSLFGGVLLISGYVLALSSASDPAPWGTGELLGIAMIVGPAGLLLANGVNQLRRRRRGVQLAPHTFMHPLYLLMTKADELIAWPLIRLQNVHLTDQHTNGAYTSTTVALDFGQLTYRIAIGGAERAREWAQAMLNARGRALLLLSKGLLGAEPGADLIPPALLAQDRTRTPAEQRRTWGRRKAMAAGLAGAALLCAISPWIAARVADRRFGATALASQSPRQWRDYLERFPDGHFASEANRALDRIYADALRRAETRAGASLPKVKRMLDTLRVSPNLRVEVAGESRWPEGDVALAPFAELAKNSRERNELLAARIKGVLARMVGPEVIEARARPEVVLNLRYFVSPSGERFEAAGQKPSPGLLVQCEAKLDAKNEVLASVSTSGPDSPSYTTTARTLREEPLVLQREMILSSLDDCAARLLSEFFHVAATLDKRASLLVKAPPRNESPYGGSR